MTESINPTNTVMSGSVRQPVHNVNFGLNVMRVVAIILTVGAHAFHLIAPHVPRSLSQIVFPNAVELFFVLSGFLVGEAWIKLLNDDSKSLSKKIMIFFKRRWIRTLPMYFIVISVLFLARIVHSGFTFAFPWKYYLFIHNFYKCEWDPYYFYPESWSLSVTEWFYVFLPVLSVLLFLFGKNAKRAVLIFSVFIILFSFLLRCYYMEHNTINTIIDFNRNIRRIVIYRFDVIGFGILGSWIKWYYKPLWTKLIPFKWVGVAIVLAATILYHVESIRFVFLPTLYYPCMGLGLLLLLPFVETIETNNTRFYEWITYISAITYSMYLLNRTYVLHRLFLPFKPYLVQSLGLSVVAYVLFFITTVFIADLFYKWIEKPIVDLRDRI